MRGQDAVSTNDSTMRLIDGNQVVAVIIESIMVDPTRAFKFSTEFLGKDPPAKLRPCLREASSGPPSRSIRWPLIDCMGAPYVKAPSS
jgi:hypothetical protein